MDENHKERKLMSHRLDLLQLFCKQMAKEKVLKFQNFKRI